MEQQRTAVPVQAEREQRSTEIAYYRIRAQILDSVLAPGSQVTEQALAERMGMSRTPIREAAIRLQGEGLLTIVPRHGVRISTLELSDVREIYQILLPLEATAVELLTLRRPDRAELTTLIAACDAMEQSLARGAAGLSAWAAADQEFHFNLIALCGNRRLAGMVMTVSDQAHRVRTFTLRMRDLPVQSTAEHRGILEAILSGDAARARGLYEDHRRRGGKALMAIIERHGLQRL